MGRIRIRLKPDQEGQSIILMALFLFFVFLVFAALAVDGTVIYLRRRQLQNMADAAALAAAEILSKGDSDADAYQAAMDSIAENNGRVEWYSTSPTPNPTTTNIGSGLDLTLGIQITDNCDVRVALAWNDIGTYFTQFVGRQTLAAGARAHANCARAGGLQPIAIKRFGDERDWNMALTNVNDADVYCDECSTHAPLFGQGLDNATDFLLEEPVDEIPEWPGWDETTHTLVDPFSIYHSPDPHANPAVPGREYYILGGGVVPNVGTVSYSGLVNLDIRHVSAPPLEYYNGVTAGTQSNTLKDMGEYYIRNGYCCDIPEPGQQVAMYNGTSAAFSPQALQETYRVGDVIAVIVYNGHVFAAPNLGMTGPDPNHQITNPTTSTISALTYNLVLKAKNGFQSAAPGLIMGVEGLGGGFVEYSLTPARPVLGRNGITQQTVTLRITPTLITTGVGTPTTHVVTGTRMFYVSAKDDDTGGTGIRRYWAGIVSVGETINGTPVSKKVATCYPTNADQNYPFISTVKGQQAKYELKLDLWNVPATQNVTVSGPGTLATGLSWVTPPPWTRSTDPTKHPGSKLQLNIKVDDTVRVGMPPHEIELSVSSAGAESSTCKLYLLVEEAGATVNDYVEILGYAAVEIMGYYNNEHPVNPGQAANAVRGRIISRLMIHPSELTLGLRARLVPWDS